MMASQLIARFPFGMMPIAILLLAEQRFGSFAVGGLAVGALCIGQAVAGPLNSAVMLRLGFKRVISVLAILSVIAMLAMVAMPTNAPALIALCGLVGFATPPIQPAVRLVYRTIVDDAELGPLFSLHASVQESIWIIGPALTVALVATLGPTASIVAAAAMLATGCAWFVLSRYARLPGDHHDEHTRPRGSVVLQPTIWSSAAVGFFMIGTGAAVEVGIVARFTSEQWVSGLVLAVCAAGSLVGGLAFGHFRPGSRSLVLFGSLFAGGIGLAVVAENPVLLAAALFVSGLGVAPTLSAIFLVVARTLPPAQAAEGYGWVGTGQLTGAALGAAFAGSVVQATAPTTAILLGFVGAMTTLLVAGTTVGRRLDALR
ncbi:MFS transporter [Pseudoclavibacter terrae]|uniref:MFS transporter n=1 Tax=Pseudoclavibacter terrae TaxID=1530195 RepID=UPI00232BC9EE|nr:MFS transporter [Pseudoclavibacter terrae]